MSNITDFPDQPPRPEFLVGPFTYYQVVVDGRAIPGLTGFKRDDGSYSLIVDRRFGGDFPDEETARQAAYLIANAMAIGAVLCSKHT